MRVVWEVAVVMLVLAGRAPAEPKSAPPAKPAACGAPCAEAAKFLGGKQWDYRKAVKVHRQVCKKDESGPPEACRRLALLGWETRGYTLAKPAVLRMLDKTCQRGDIASCAWSVVIGADALPDLAKLTIVEAPCGAGDRAACEPLLVAVERYVHRRKPCAAEWWTLVDRTCKAGFPEGCIAYHSLLSMAEDTCAAPSNVLTLRETIDILHKQCAGGFPDACSEIFNTNEDLEVRCKAGEQFACDALSSSNARVR